MKCFMDELGKDDGRCENEARYLVLTNASSARMYMCEEHAQEERAHDDVWEIESLPRLPSEGSQ
jgi:hypothetical protein